MMILLMLLLLFSSTVSGQSMDIFQLNGYIDLMSAFPQFVPDDILALLREITPEEKHQIIDVVNDLNSGKIGDPKNVEEALAMIKSRTPRLYTRLQKINETFTEQFQKLRPATRNKVLDWGKLLFQNFNKKFDDEIEAKMQPLKVVSTILNSYSQQTPELKDDFRSVFPKISALFESDFIKMVISQMQLQLSMQSLLVLAALVGVGCCFVQGPINDFDVSTKIFLLKSLGREFTPDEILDVVETITDREKAEIVNVYNKMRTASPEEIPKSAKEGMDYLKKNAPSLAPKVEKALNKMKPKFDAMKTETKQALLKMLNDLFSAGDRPAEEREFWINYFQSMLPQKYSNLPDSVRSDVRRNMPKIDKFLTSFQFRGDADGAKLRAFMGAGALHFDPWKAFNHQCDFPSC